MYSLLQNRGYLKKKKKYADKLSSDIEKAYSLIPNNSQPLSSPFLPEDEARGHGSFFTTMSLC